MAAKSHRVAHPWLRCRQRTASSSGPVEKRVLTLDVEKLRSGGVDGQGDLFPEIVRRHPLFKGSHEVLRFTVDGTEVDGAPGGGGLDDVDNPPDRILRRHLERRRPGRVEMLRSNAED